MADADLLIVLKDGYVAEQGSHAQLMAKEGGVYRGMWDQQNEMMHEQLEQLEEAEAAEADSEVDSEVDSEKKRAATAAPTGEPQRT